MSTSPLFCKNACKNAGPVNKFDGANPLGDILLLGGSD